MTTQATIGAQATEPVSMRHSIANHDWTATPLGEREAWPLNLKLAVDMMLGSGHAICLAWGAERILLYNDSYAPFLGARHPAALGKPFAEVWSEIWDDIGPLVDRTFEGETTTMQDMPLEMTRNGYPEATWWTFSYSPVRDEAGAVSGLLNIASDSTPRMVARQQRDRAVAELRESEAFMSGVLAASTDRIKVLDLDGKLTFMSEGGQHVMEISDFNAVAGCPWPDFWQDAGNVEAKAAVEAARNGEARSFIGKADTFRGTPKWWHVAVSPIMDADGRPERILSVSRDITELRQSEEARDRFIRLAENSQDFTSMTHLDGHMFYLNDGARRLVGLDGIEADQLTIDDFFPESELQRIRSEVMPAVEHVGHWSGELCFRHFVTGELIPTLHSMFPITNAAGAMTGYGTVARDFREHKRLEEQQHLLNGELSHRLKNTLTVVQAIASQTLAGADTEVASTFSRRLMALATAHDVLIQRSWSHGQARDLAERVLATFDKGGQVTIEGPDLVLGSRASLALSLLLHELATNAMKYGALSTPAGHVTLTWSIEGDGDDATVAMRWAERGGPPAVAPTRKGFGSRIIRMGLSGSGGVALRYEHQEFIADMTAMIAQLRLA